MSKTTDPKKLIASDRAPSLSLSRRMALKAIAAIGAAPTLSVADVEPDSALTPGLTLRREGTSPSGTPTDPFLHSGIVPWERSLSTHALDTLADLADIIMPADERSPAASTLGCHEFIDEWISAPYPRQQADAQKIFDGLEWLDQESQSRFQIDTFLKLSQTQKFNICDDICLAQPFEPRFDEPSQFFSLVRSLTAGAFWTTQEGMADLQYIGNVALPKWELPPPEVLKHLGLDG